MNWITTNLRLPEDVYMALKMKAAQERRSVSSIIRDRITDASSDSDDEDLVAELQSLSAKITKTAKRKNLTGYIIKNRYKHV